MLSSTKHKDEIMVSTRNKGYGNLNPSTSKVIDQSTSSTQSNSDPSPNLISTKLTIEPPKGVIHKSTFNPCVRVA